MRVYRAARDVIFKPEKGDTVATVMEAFRHPLLDRIGSDWVLQVTTNGSWAFVPPESKR